MRRLTHFVPKTADRPTIAVRRTWGGETLLPIGKVDPGLRDVSMRLDLSKVPDMAREVEALGGSAQAHH